MSIDFFDAVDKHSITKEDLERASAQADKLSFSPYGVFDNNRFSLPGIVACSMSHLALLKSVRDHVDDDGVVVFEDDVLPLPGAECLEERIALVRKKFPEVEGIVCNGFLEPRSMHGLQLLDRLVQGEKIFWDENLHASTIDGAMASKVLVSPPGSFFNWYSLKGVDRMVELIEGREFFGVDLLYGAFAHQGVFAILTPGIGYHPPKSEVGSYISSPPYTVQHTI